MNTDTEREELIVDMANLMIKLGEKPVPGLLDGLADFILDREAKAIKKAEHTHLDSLLRINQKAEACAMQESTGYEELAVVYDRAVMKEIADLTTPRINTNEGKHE